MADGTTTLAERESALAAARCSLESFDSVLATASGSQLVALLTVLDEVAARASAARTAVAVEAVGRGEVAGSEVHGWLREHAPSLRQGAAAAVARVAVDVASAGAGLAGPLHEPSLDTPLGLVWQEVRTGRLEAGTGCAVLREAGRLAPLLQDAAVPTVTAGLVELATEHGTSMMRRLRPRLLSEHGRSGAFDELQDRLSGAARLSMPYVESADLTEYQLWMTPAQAATLEATIGPLSATQPNAETGEADLRPAGQRRVEALTAVCQVAAAATADARAGTTGFATALHVTVPVTDLVAERGSGEVLGSTADGTLLAPDTLRRLACDAALIPHVLGTAGEPLAVGAARRLFTRAQRRHLTLRDRGCTYPGCTAPAAWTKAHHVRHWADHGPTDVGNAALLCQRHHTTVHRRRLWAQVRERPDERGRSVVWDRTAGSYDRALAEHPPPSRGPTRGLVLPDGSPAPGPWRDTDGADLPWWDPPLPALVDDPAA